MKLKSACIFANPSKPQAVKVEKEIAEFLLSRGVRVVTPDRAQVMVTVGGDGTILNHKNRFNLPIFAVGSHTSFLCQTVFSRWQKDFERLVKNGFTLEKRTMLSSALDGKILPDALNEVVIRNREHRILALHLVVGSQPPEHQLFRADGIMFSTATGSKAYAYSCGGVEMRPSRTDYQIVAIAPFRRLFKPTLVKPGIKSRVTVESTCTADAVVDGQFEVPVRRRCQLEVWVAKRKVNFVKIMPKKKPKT